MIASMRSPEAARVIDGLRKRLGRVGVWTNVPVVAEPSAARDAVAEIEELGYWAVWYPEAVWKESFSAAALVLSWTSRLVAASGITNVYARDATSAASGAKTLADAFPGRFVLGLGCSHEPLVQMRGHVYGKPVSTMRAYLDAMDSAPYEAHEPAEPAPRVLAALGPRMLDLAAERTAGAHPYFVPVEHTAFARERLGPEPYLAVEQAVVLESDAARALDVIRPFASFYVAADNYRRNLLRLGWPEADLSDGGSDRLLEAVVVHGDEGAIRERVRAHLEAGADHVCIQALPNTSVEAQLGQLRALAPALLDL
jgi:probable F420-dependent oxidoreductase